MHGPHAGGASAQTRTTKAMCVTARCSQSSFRDPQSCRSCSSTDFRCGLLVNRLLQHASLDVSPCAALHPGGGGLQARGPAGTGCRVDRAGPGAARHQAQVPQNAAGLPDGQGRPTPLHGRDQAHVPRCFCPGTVSWSQLWEPDMPLQSHSCQTAPAAHGQPCNLTQNDMHVRSQQAEPRGQLCAPEPGVPHPGSLGGGRAQADVRHVQRSRSPGLYCHEVLLH
jgi:hypothetical protein